MRWRGIQEVANSAAGYEIQPVVENGGTLLYAQRQAQANAKVSIPAKLRDRRAARPRRRRSEDASAKSASASVAQGIPVAGRSRFDAKGGPLTPRIARRRTSPFPPDHRLDRESSRGAPAAGDPPRLPDAARSACAIGEKPYPGAWR